MRNLIHSDLTTLTRVWLLLTRHRSGHRGAVFDRIRGEVHEDFFERCALGCQLIDGDTSPERRFTDLVGRESTHRQSAVVRHLDDCLLRLEGFGQGCDV